jgi:polyphosphate glucokinase
MSEAAGATSTTHAESAKARRTPVTLAVDVGGSNIKAMLLDRVGRPITERVKHPTPRPATKRAVTETIVKIAAEVGAFDRVSVGFPGVIADGCTLTAANLDGKWKGYDLRATLHKQLGRPVHVTNDADMQGFGAIAGKGVELTITLGTGVGSALFVDGVLVPNLELGHHGFRKCETYEEQLGQKALQKIGKKRWRRRLKLAIAQMLKVFNPRHLYLGGGNARLINFKLPRNVTAVPNEAGILGGIALWKTQRDPHDTHGG